VLEIVAGAKILELRLHHRPQVSRGVMAEFHHAAGITLEYEDHSAADLSGRHCHVRIFQTE
jgi:hypothetical protein